MSVEVRQMIVKSNVRQDANANAQGCADDEAEGGNGKKDCSEECRRLILETLREMKER